MEETLDRGVVLVRGSAAGFAQDQSRADCETKTGMLDFIEREISPDGQLSEEHVPG